MARCASECFQEVREQGRKRGLRGVEREKQGERGEDLTPTTGASYNDKLELATNLLTITQPDKTDLLRFHYLPQPGIRDKVTGQTWGTGEQVNLTYTSPTEVQTTDALGQVRTHVLSPRATDYNSDRPHILSVTDKAVPTAVATVGQVPGAMTPGGIPTPVVDRTYSFVYDAEGLLRMSSLDGVRQTTNVWKTVEPNAPGFVLQSTTTAGVALPSARTAGTTTIDPPIAITVSYQIGPQAGPFDVARVAGTSATIVGSGLVLSINGTEASASTLEYTDTNDTARTTTLDEFGRVRSITSTGGTDADSAGAAFSIDYFPRTAAEYERGLPRSIVSGDDETSLETTIQYPNENTIVETDPRGIRTTTTRDEWGRPTHVTVSGDGVNIDQTWRYDANGRVHDMTRKQGSETVTTTWAYDAIGRTTLVKTSGVAVDGGKTEITSTVDYDLDARRITTIAPSGSITVTELDSLGRTVRTTTTTGGAEPIETRIGYDIADNPVYTTDMLVASGAAWDIHGRAIETLSADGSRSEMTYDAWGRATEMRSRAADGTLVGQTNLELTAAGRLSGAHMKVDDGLTRLTEFSWDGGGRTSAVATGKRASHSTFDITGRRVKSEAGEGTRSGVTDVFSTTGTQGFSGGLPTSVVSGEKGGQYQLGFDYDNVGNPTLAKVGPHEWHTKYDEAGNVVLTQQPNRPAATYEYDTRGALTKETKADGAVVQYAYDALGAPTGYTDPTNEATTTTTDLLGRPTLRVYADGTTESWTYNRHRLESYTDRQGRKRGVDYNDKGQIVRILGNGNVVLEQIDYDLAGRVIRRTNKDAAVEYDNFNFAGQPRTTRQIRYANESGLAGKIILDQYEQTHDWNEHGERTEGTMPSYVGLALDGGWTRSLTNHFDAMGNLVGIDRTLWNGSSQTLMSADFRNAGRPDSRAVRTDCTSVTFCSQTSIVRQYGYDATTGQLNGMRVSSEGLEIAGSSIKYDGVQRSEAVLLGLSGGERSNQWSYDARGRLASSSHAKASESTPAIERLTPSDFRNELDRPEVTEASPKSMTFTESTAGHRIEEVEKGEVTRDIGWDGSEMVDDGRFVYSFDTYGRLVMVTEKVTDGPSSLSVRRIRYSYTPTNRLAGRRAEYATLAGAGVEPLETDWRLEDRGGILAADALPAETTFVWNPFADTIDAVFQAGASEQVGLPNGGLVRQIIHGGLSYDDPIEVTAVDPNGTGGALTRLYPVYDEAGAGMLQAILNASGDMVARTFADGAYGEDEYALPGPAVDRIAVTATKDDTGNLTEVKVTLRLTEQIDEATLGNGLRLAALAADGSVLRTSEVAPSLTDNWTAGWTLTVGEWSTLIDGASSISIAATNTLRAARWADTPVLTVPDWATSSKPVFSSAALPVESRESVTTLGEWITDINADSEKTVALYEVPDLAAIAGSQDAAGDPRKLLVAATFHAHPFHESLTGKNYVRARWYAPELGNFLSPDPLGYQDSSNLYAFAGGDPVNGRDPTGEESLGQLIHGWTEDAFDSGNWAAIAGAAVGETIYAAFEVASAGAVGKIDAAQEALDRGEISEGDYWKRTTVAVGQTAASYAVGGVAGRAGAQMTQGLTSRIVQGAVAGAAGGGGGLLASDVVGIASGMQDELSSWQSYGATMAFGAAFGAASGYKSASDKEIGDYGEEVARKIMAKRGYSDVQSIQNNSNQGIDVAGSKVPRRWRFAEVKASRSNKPPPLKGDQKLGANSFVNSRLRRASGGTARGWRVTSDPTVSTRARTILRDIRANGGAARGFIVEIRYTGTIKQQVTFRRWVQ